MKKLIVAIMLLYAPQIFCQTSGKAKNLKCIETSHLFSNHKQPDRFQLTYNTDSLEDLMNFKIVDFEGKVIYDENFMGYSFYGYDRPWFEFETDTKRKKLRIQNITDSLMVYDSLRVADRIYLEDKINHFFSENKFEINPIPKLLEFGTDSFIKGEYEEFTKTNDFISFTYIISAGAGVRIAYSKQKKKAVIYWSCC